MDAESQIEGQMFLDGLQPVDIQRVMGNPQQRSDYDRLMRHAEGLGWLATSYAIKWREMPAIKQVNGVDQNGFPIVEFPVR